MPVALTISELADRSRTPVSSIKFYLREALLPVGDLEAEHRAFYGHRHLRRLQLIQVLRDVGKLPIPVIRDVCKLLDGDGGRDRATVIARVIDALGRKPRGSAPSREVTAARREVIRMLGAKRMRVRSDARSVRDLADALVALRQVIGPEVSASAFEPYLDAMCALATRDFELNKHLVVDSASAAVGATYATVLWEPVLLLLRRIAHEHVAVKTFRRKKA